MGTVEHAFAWEYANCRRILLRSTLAALVATWVIMRFPPSDWRTLTGFTLTTASAAGLFLAAATIFTGTVFDPTSSRGGFPAWKFRLPVRTWRLVAFPMSVGTLVAVVGCAFILRVVWRMPEYAVIPWAPEAAAAAAMLWLQALSWWPFASETLRLVVSLFTLAGLAAGFAGVGIAFDWRPPALSTYLLASASVAAILAYVGVSRDRVGARGEMIRFAPWTSARALKPFASPLKAQVWYEWRGSGRVIPSLTVPLAFLCCLIADVTAVTESRPIPPVAVAAILALPALITMTNGAVLGKQEWRSNKLRISAFQGTLPITGRVFVSAKLRNASRAILAAAVGCVVATPLLAIPALLPRGAVSPAWKSLLAGASPRQTIAALICGYVLLYFQAWKSAAGAIAVSLTGRSWIVYSYFILLSLIIFGLMTYYTFYISIFGFAILEPAARLPLLLGVALAVKLVVALLINGAAIRLGAASFRETARGLLVNVAALLVLFLGVWSLAPTIVEAHPVTAAIGLALLPPLSRGRAALLAHDWNRHR